MNEVNICAGHITSLQSLCLLGNLACVALPEEDMHITLITLIGFSRSKRRDISA